MLTNRYGEQILLNQCFYIGEGNIVLSEFGESVDMQAYHKHLQAMSNPTQYKARVQVLVEQLKQVFDGPIVAVDYDAGLVGGLEGKNSTHKGFYLYNYQGKPYSIERTSKKGRLLLYNPQQRTTLSLFTGEVPNLSTLGDVCRKYFINVDWVSELQYTLSYGYRHLAL